MVEARFCGRFWSGLTAGLQRVFSGLALGLVGIDFEVEGRGRLGIVFGRCDVVAIG